MKLSSPSHRLFRSIIPSNSYFSVVSIVSFDLLYLGNVGWLIRILAPHQDTISNFHDLVRAFHSIRVQSFLGTFRLRHRQKTETLARFFPRKNIKLQLPVKPTTLPSLLQHKFLSRKPNPNHNLKSSTAPLPPKDAHLDQKHLRKITANTLFSPRSTCAYRQI